MKSWYIYIYLYFRTFNDFSFGALSLFAGWQEGSPACAEMSWVGYGLSGQTSGSGYDPVQALWYGQKNRETDHRGWRRRRAVNVWSKSAAARDTQSCPVVRKHERTSDHDRRPRWEMLHGPTADERCRLCLVAPPDVVPSACGPHITHTQIRSDIQV